MENSKKTKIAIIIGIICLFAGILNLIIFFFNSHESGSNLLTTGIVAIGFGLIMLLLARKKPSN